MLQRAIEPIPLRGVQFVEVGLDAPAGFGIGATVLPLQVLGDVFAREHGLCDVVRTHR